MEWFWTIIENLQKSDFFTALQGFQPIDWVVLFVVLWGLAQGSRKGFSEMFGKLLGIFLVSMLTLSFYKPVSTFLNAHMALLPMSAAEPFAFFLLSVFLWLSVSWGLNVFGKFFKVEAQGMLKTVGGMVLGGVRMMFLMSFLVQFLLFLPIDSLKNDLKPGNTYTGNTIAKLVPNVHKWIVGPFLKPARKKTIVSYKTGG